MKQGSAALLLHGLCSTAGEPHAGRSGTARQQLSRSDTNPLRTKFESNTLQLRWLRPRLAWLNHLNRSPIGVGSACGVAGLPAGVWVTALVAAWVLFGLVGHDPWKADEAHTFGVVLDYLRHRDWVVPTLAGEPFVEKPPLFY